MSFPTLTIERETKGHSGRKTRVFSVRLLGYLGADSLWDCPVSGTAIRPIWIAYFGTESEARPFTANFRASRKATTPTRDSFQIPKKAPYRWTTCKVPGGVVTVAYLPELFHLDPASPFVEEIRFVFAPGRWWLEREAAALAPELGEEAWEAARAALFAAYLDRRTGWPLVRDLRFHLQLYRAALDAGWVHEATASRRVRSTLYGSGLAAAGLEEPLACRVDPATFGDFLAEQTSHYHREEIRRGTTRIAADRRVLPDAPWAPVQLGLDLALA